eukprot:167688_1
MSTSTANAPLNHISPSQSSSLSPSLSSSASLSPSLSMSTSNTQTSSSEIVLPLVSSSIIVDSASTAAATAAMRANMDVTNNANESTSNDGPEVPNLEEAVHVTNSNNETISRMTFGERVKKAISILACVASISRSRRSNRNRWQRTVKVKRKRDLKKHLIIKEVKKNGATAETESRDKCSATTFKKRFGNSIYSKANHPSHNQDSDESSVTDGDDFLPSPEPSSRDVGTADMNMNEPEKDSSSDCVQVISVSCQVKKAVVGPDETSLRIIDCSHECPICLSNFKVGEKVCWSKGNSCSHGFHLDCMLAWLQNHVNCPLCRRRYLIPKEDEEDHRQSTDRPPSLRFLRQRRS